MTEWLLLLPIHDTRFDHFGDVLALFTILSDIYPSIYYRFTRLPRLGIDRYSNRLD